MAFTGTTSYSNPTALGVLASISRTVGASASSSCSARSRQYLSSAVSFPTRSFATTVSQPGPCSLTSCRALAVISSSVKRSVAIGLSLSMSREGIMKAEYVGIVMGRIRSAAFVQPCREPQPLSKASWCWLHDPQFLTMSASVDAMRDKTPTGFMARHECSPVMVHHDGEGASTVQRRPVAAYSILTFASKSWDASQIWSGDERMANDPS